MGRKEYIATCYSDLVKDIIKIRLHICRNWKKKDCPREEEEDMKCPNQEEDNSKKSTVRTGVAYKREDRREQKKKSIQQQRENSKNKSKKEA